MAKPRAVIKPRQRFAKGRRPYFFADPAIDKLLGMVMALTGEVAVLRERLDTHERLAAKGKVATPANIEKYAPDLKVEDEREAVRAAMLSRVFRLIAVDDTRAAESEAAYQDYIARFSR
ncbi:MAG: hypothetical protein SFV21_09355 [Rhodospirillaceae bacterium]|nr:hypothetical protein [Rhodospirillaceae bacterium]